MKIALDSNRYVDLVRNVAEALEILQRAKVVYVPFVVLAELRSGFACGQRSAENEAVLTRFLQKPGVLTLHPDDQTTQVYARLYAQLRSRGKPIPVNDLWIAALVLQHNLVLFSRDKHFEAIPQLAII